MVECRTPEREVGGSKPTAAVLCPWARHFTPRKYWLITQEAVAPSRHDWKIVDWDVKPQHKQNLAQKEVSGDIIFYLTAQLGWQPATYFPINQRYFVIILSFVSVLALLCILFFFSVVVDASFTQLYSLFFHLTLNLHNSKLSFRIHCVPSGRNEIYMLFLFHAKKI